MVLNKKLIAFVSILFCSVNLFAAKIPQLKGFVNDYANVISSNDERELMEYLSSVEKTTGIQICVLTMPSLEGEDIDSFAIKVCDEWKLGEPGKDNGALLLLAMAERDLRIEVGYGLEDKLTDVKCGLILRNVVIPEFRNGNYSGGLLKGAKNMAGIATDNVQLVSHRVMNSDENYEESEDFEGFVFMIVWLLIIFILITSRGGLFKWILLDSLLGGRGRRHGRYYGPPPTFKGGSNFRGGGTFGGGSSFGGGSFHGGGGRFGGGGASAHF